MTFLELQLLKKAVGFSNLHLKSCQIFFQNFITSERLVLAGQFLLEVFKFFGFKIYPNYLILERKQIMTLFHENLKVGEVQEVIESEHNVHFSTIRKTCKKLPIQKSYLLFYINDKITTKKQLRYISNAYNFLKNLKWQQCHRLLVIK